MHTDNEEFAEDIHERFIPLDVKELDSKKRISLGEKIFKQLAGKFKTKLFRVYIGQDGDILLRPVVTIPEKEAWIYKNPDVLGSIRKGLDEASIGKFRKITDLEEFIKNL